MTDLDTGDEDMKVVVLIWCQLYAWCWGFYSVCLVPRDQQLPYGLNLARECNLHELLTDNGSVTTGHRPVILISTVFICSSMCSQQDSHCWLFSCSSTTLHVTRIKDIDSIDTSAIGVTQMYMIRTRKALCDGPTCMWVFQYPLVVGLSCFHP